MIHDQTISQTQVTRLPLGTYDFVVHYAEMLNEATAEFRHSHSYMELFYIRQGELTIRFGDEDVSMNGGDLMLVPAQTPHHVLNIPGEKKSYFVMIFELKPVKSHGSRQSSDFREVHELDALLKQLPQNKFTYCAANWDAGIFLDQICTELYEKKFGWIMFANMLYYGFFLYAIRLIVSIENERTEVDDALNLAIEATKYIHAHYAEDISLETLAAHLYISPRHANRMFRKMFNTTFGKTLRSLRLTYAKTLLATTDLSAEDIAERVGLSSAQALRKLFKQSEDITISQFIASCRNQQQ
jgi:AraC-like DNA-binding protein/mannose-6-phosphate isomerase-like protein (cupin superfamily)